MNVGEFTFNAVLVIHKGYSLPLRRKLARGKFTGLEKEVKGEQYKANKLLHNENKSNLTLVLTLVH